MQTDIGHCGNAQALRSWLKPASLAKLLKLPVMARGLSSHPTAGPLSPGAIAGIKKALGRQTPLLRDATMVSVAVQLGSSSPPDMVTETAPKFFSRDSATAVTIRNESIVIETTKYDRYERLRELAHLAFEARQVASPVDGIDRIGLRYIDEIRVPDMDGGVSPTAWSAWIDASLLGPAPLGEGLGLTPAQLQGLAMFEKAPDQSLVLRYGPRDGYAVNPDGDLKRTTTPPGPFFLVDIDSFWMAQAETPEPDVDWILRMCDALHAPVRALFERLITNRLREEVLRDGD